MITGSKQACDSFSADGSGARAALYYSSPKKLYGWGSEELVTGFFLEALLHYRLTRSK